MSSNNALTKLKQNAFQRRLSVAVAGAGSGARLLGSHASSVFKEKHVKAAIRSDALSREASTFAKTLGELKGAYVKIGQMMAMYGEHLLPPEITAALRELEDSTQTMDWVAIEPALQQQLASNYDQLAISRTPVAAASLSQVHKAKIVQTNRDLCLKVQYPGVSDTIESDFDAMLKMLKLTRWVPNGKEFEIWMREIKQMLIDETDYLREADMIQRVAALIGEDDRYVVPAVHREWSTDKLLAMDFLPGMVVTDKQIAALSLARRNALAKAMLENFFAEVFDWGLMQTDPNFGNYRIQLRNSRTEPDKLVLLDFGAVRELPKGFRTALCGTILAAHKQDKAEVIEAAIQLGCLQRRQTDSVKSSFADFCILLMEPFRTNHEQTPSHALNAKGHYDWHNSKLLKRVGKQGARAILTEGFSSPPKEFALIARKLSGVFTFISTLKAEFNAAPLIEKYL